MSKYLDSNGLLYLWGKIKALVGGKVDKVEGKGLSANDYSDEDMATLGAIADAMYQAPTATQFRASTPAYSGTGSITEATVAELLGTETLAGLTASGTDDAGSSLYDLVINGVTTGSYTEDAVLSEIVADINSSKTAGVSVSYSEGKFIFTAKKLGAAGNITIGEGLAGALFDVDGQTDWSSGKFADSYVLDWLDEGESTTLTFRIPGDSSMEINIPPETTIGEVVTQLSNSPMGTDHTFACNRYTGQIEAKKKASGAKADLEITNDWGGKVKFYEDAVPADPYTYGQDAVLVEIATDEEIAAMLDEVFGTAE